MVLSGLAFAGLLAFAAAGFPPQPEGVKTIKSKYHKGIKLSYKEPGICETTPGVKSYSGYVHLPPNTLNETEGEQDYPINTFFWFFESRKDPANAPLAIWLNGGPGGSSLMGALSENGPCFVEKGSNDTYLNPWSWNNEANLLFIDQPNQVGFSYGTATNVTATLEKGLEGGWNFKPADFSDGVPETNLTFLVGTTGSQNPSFTANSTRHAAAAVWHFAQTWFEEFPFYKPDDEQISLFTESYGGRYGPAFFAHFMRQNELIANGTISGPGVHYMHLNTLGIVNGCVNFEDQAMGYVNMAYNNTYGIQHFTELEYYHAMYELQKPGGLVERFHECQKMVRELDPSESGAVKKVNEFCSQVEMDTHNVTSEVYMKKREGGWFDVTHPAEDPFPPAYLMTYLNQHWVQAALGVPVNHTAASAATYEAFTSTSDMTKGGQLDDIAYLLEKGVKVVMMYGDRDYACNWIGGEQSSLKVPWSNQAEFKAAGYAPLVVSPVHSGGLTRQYGNFSFTRVYQAGHLVPSYQPEVSYEIFMRALTGRDIATGTVDLRKAAANGHEYSTEGPSDTWWMRSEVLPPPEPECYYIDPGRCTDDELDSLFDGTAIVKDWIVVGREKKGEKTVDEKPKFALPDLLQSPLMGTW